METAQQLLMYLRSGLSRATIVVSICPVRCLILHIMISLTIMANLSNPESWECCLATHPRTADEGYIYWHDYSVPGGTFRENMFGKMGQSLLSDDHPGATFRWNVG